MARRLAVWSSHAAGRSGTPSTGQRCRATTTASCTRSSARSKSPVIRTSEPQMRPTSARNTAFIASAVGSVIIAAQASPVSADRMMGHVVVVHHRADLDGLVFRRPLLGNGDRLVQIRHVDRDEPGDVLLAFPE